MNDSPPEGCEVTNSARIFDSCFENVKLNRYLQNTASKEFLNVRNISYQLFLVLRLRIFCN